MFRRGAAARVAVHGLYDPLARAVLKRMACAFFHLGRITEAAWYAMRPYPWRQWPFCGTRRVVDAPWGILHVCARCLRDASTMLDPSEAATLLLVEQQRYTSVALPDPSVAAAMVTTTTTEKPVQEAAKPARRGLFSGRK